MELYNNRSTYGTELGLAVERSSQPANESDTGMERRTRSRYLSFASFDKQHVWNDCLQRLDTHDHIAGNIRSCFRDDVLLAFEREERCRDKCLLRCMEFHNCDSSVRADLGLAAQCSGQPAGEPDVDLEWRLGRRHLSFTGLNGQHFCHDGV